MNEAKLVWVRRSLNPFCESRITGSFASYELCLSAIVDDLARANGSYAPYPMMELSGGRLMEVAKFLSVVPVREEVLG